jgi:hypothetical protein
VRRLAATTIVGLALLVSAPGCSDKTKADVKTTISDASSDVSTGASKLSDSATSAGSELSSSVSSATGN